MATGALDSPQATLLPLAHLAGLGLDPGTAFTVRRFDVMVGKHGDHVGGERDAVKALVAGEVDAACVIDGNQLAFAREGTIAAGAVRVLTRTPPYDHCTMTVLDDVDRRRRSTGSSSCCCRCRTTIPACGRCSSSKGLTRVAARSHRRATTSSRRAVDRLGFYGADGSILAEGYRR